MESRGTLAERASKGSCRSTWSRRESCKETPDKSSDRGSVDQNEESPIPFSMSWNPDFCNYNFSREEDLDLDENVMPSKQVHTGNVMSGSTFEPEIQKMCCSQKWTERHTILLGLEEILASQEEPKLDISNGTSSWSASDYLKSFSSSTTDNPARRSLEGESLDLTEPRMESFWHHNVFSV